MRFIQLVEFDASHSAADVRDAMDAWLALSRGKRPLQMALVAADHDRPNHLWNLLMFPSEQEAVENSQLPETKSAFERWAKLLDGEPVFHDLDVVNHLGGPSAAPVDAGSAVTRALAERPGGWLSAAPSAGGGPGLPQGEKPGPGPESRRYSTGQTGRTVRPNVSFVTPASAM